MTNATDTGILFGLVAALCWGTADYCARGATRAGGTYRTLLYIQIVAILALLAIGLPTGLLRLTHLPLAAVLLTAAIQLVIMLGAALLYRAFAIGTLALVSPIAASYAALTALLSLLSGEHPAAPQLLGIGLTLCGVVLASTVSSPSQPKLTMQPAVSPSVAQSTAPLPAAEFPPGPASGEGAREGRCRVPTRAGVHRTPRAAGRPRWDAGDTQRSWQAVTGCPAEPVGPGGIGCPPGPASGGCPAEPVGPGGMAGRGWELGTSLAPGLVEALGALLLFGVGYWALRYVVGPLGGYTTAFIGKAADLVALAVFGLTASLILARRAPGRAASFQIAARPAPRFLLWVVPNALLDTAANVAYNLGIAGSLTSIVSVISSLFAAVTVLLAWIFLHERLTRWQWLGIAAIFAGVALVSM